MSTISIPFPKELEDFINQQIELGNAATKAEVVRRAVQKMKEDMAYQELLESEQDVKEGKVYFGDLKDLLRKIDND